MNSYFTAKVRYAKVDEKGISKNVTEEYLVDSMTFTETEKKITEYCEKLSIKEFRIMSIKYEKVSEVLLNAEAERFFRCVVSFITLDEKQGKEKKSRSTYLVAANSMDAATEAIKEKMRGGLIDFELYSVSETAIAEVILHEDSATEDEAR